jgi:hypothetical protein
MANSQFIYLNGALVPYADATIVVSSVAASSEIAGTRDC